jgi:hypothetical protein
LANTPSRDGPQELAGSVLELIAICLAGAAAVMLMAMQSRQLTKKVVVAGIVLAVVPYPLLLGSPGYVFNAVFLVAAVSSAVALWRYPNMKV